MSSTLYRHGVVHSAADPFAEALLVDDGTIVWLGADDTADATSGLPHLVAYRGEQCVTVDDAREILVAIPGLTGIGGDLNIDGSLGSHTAAVRSPMTWNPPCTPARVTAVRWLQICSAVR